MLHSRRVFDQPSLDHGGDSASSVLPASSSAIVLGQEPSRLVTRVLVAGYDGSPLAREAVVEAGLQAGATGCVFVVYAYHLPPAFLGWPHFGRKLSEARGAGHRALADLLIGGTWLPNAEYIPELIEGKPAEAIARVAAARHAKAIVVGSTGARRQRGKRASVSHELERTVRVPVITTH